MKKLLSASLPALALLALGGCTATRSVATTEDDGVYYSSKDRTTAVVRSAPAAQAAAPASAGTGTDEATNPDYQAADNRRAASNAPEYYDDGYSSSSYDPNSRFHQPYAGPTVGLAYYSPPVVFAPAIVSYGYGAGGYGYSPYGGFYDPYYSSAFASPYYSPYAFYDPFYSPFGYGFGSFININISFGRSWGGYGYGRPYYGAYAYDPYYGGYGRGYGGGGYSSYYGGNGGYYGGGNSGYYRNRQVIRPNGSNGTYADGSNPVLVGPRRGRGGDVLAGRGNAVATPGSGSAVPTTGQGRRGGIVGSPAAPVDGLTAPAPTTSSSSAAAGGNYGGRRRQSIEATAPNSPTAITDHDQPAAGRRRTDDATTGSRLGSYETTAPTPGSEPNGSSRRRWRDLNEGTTTTGAVSGNESRRGYEQPQPADAQPQPTEQRPTRRARIFESAPDNGQGQVTRTYEQPAPQPEPQRTYERPQRTYERPAEQPQQRTYERPAEQPQQSRRSYEQPSQPSQPSYSAPSSSGSSGSNSGGNSGGGGSSGGGGGRRGGRN